VITSGGEGRRSTIGPTIPDNFLTCYATVPSLHTGAALANDAHHPTMEILIRETRGETYSMGDIAQKDKVSPIFNIMLTSLPTIAWKDSP
jgi:hypothetical protein